MSISSSMDKTFPITMLVSLSHQGLSMSLFLSVQLHLVTELRYTVTKTARFVKGFKTVTSYPFCQITLHMLTLQTRTNDSHFMTVLLWLHNFCFTVLVMPICHKSFQSANSNRPTFLPRYTFVHIVFPADILFHKLQVKSLIRI